MAEASAVTTPSHLAALRLLASVASLLRDFTGKLERQAAVSSVRQSTELYPKGGSPAVEWFVDAEMTPGSALSWHLLVYWSEDHWIIEASVSRINAKGGYDTIFEWAPRHVQDQNLNSNLIEATNGLIDSSTRFLP